MEKTLFEMTQDFVMSLGQAKLSKDKIGEEAAIIVAIRPAERGGESDKDIKHGEVTAAVMGKNGHLFDALLTIGRQDRDMRVNIIKAASRLILDFD